VGATPPYEALMRFGRTAGGAHTVDGRVIDPAQSASRTFHAVQSAVGCDAGVGAAACGFVCGAQGLAWTQVRARCGLGGGLDGLDGAVLTDWREVYPSGAHRSSAARFAREGARGLRLVGSDDGIRFWTLSGSVLEDARGDGQLRVVVDFSPKGGPKDLPGAWDGERIKWADGNRWSRDAPACAIDAVRRVQQAAPADAAPASPAAEVCWREHGGWS